ncbi:MAG: 2-oxoacid:ferredoxin oxidoreductase subunit beta [Polyangiaceae bacterium]
MNALIPPVLTKKDFTSSQDPRWCPGCGDYAILSTVQKVLPELGIPKENIVWVSGIGCSSRFPYYVNTYGLHSIHGRALPIATGIRVANPQLSVWVATGDGDSLSIGGNHLLHCLRRNVNLRVLLFNNRIYGLTKGQYSPTSEQGKVTKSSPLGAADTPLDPFAFALGSGGTFFARTYDVAGDHLANILRRAASHRGTALIEILQNCSVFNDGAFDSVVDRSTMAERQLRVEHGKPLRFGERNHRGLTFDLATLSLKVVDLELEPAREPELFVFDETNPAHGMLLSRLDPTQFPLPLGVLHARQRPTYEDSLADQQAQASAKGPVGLNELFRSGNTWRVEPAEQPAAE